MLARRACPAQGSMFRRCSVLGASQPSEPGEHDHETQQPDLQTGPHEWPKIPALVEVVRLRGAYVEAGRPVPCFRFRQALFKLPTTTPASGSEWRPQGRRASVLATVPSLIGVLTLVVQNRKCRLTLTCSITQFRHLPKRRSGCHRKLRNARSEAVRRGRAGMHGGRKTAASSPTGLPLCSANGGRRKSCRTRAEVGPESLIESSSS